MSARTPIPAPNGVADPIAKRVLESLKRIVEQIAGISPDRKPIQKLGPGASLSGVINKVNEIIERLQE